MKTYLIDKKTGEYYEEKETIFEKISLWFSFKWTFLKDKYYSIKNVIRRIYHYYPRQVIKAACVGHNFDYAFLYDLEYAKLKEILKAQEWNYDKHIKWAEKEPEKKNEILDFPERNVRHIKLAISLLEIIMEKRDLYDYAYNDGEEKGLIFYEIDKPDVKEKTYTIKFNGQYKCLVNVNLKNANRFGNINKEHYKYLLKNNQHEIYKLKAIHCYNLLREYFMEEWWL